MSLCVLFGLSCLSFTFPSAQPQWPEMEEDPVNADDLSTTESYVPIKGIIPKLAEKILCPDIKWKSFFFFNNAT